MRGAKEMNWWLVWFFFGWVKWFALLFKMKAVKIGSWQGGRLYWVHGGGQLGASGGRDMRTM